MRLTSELRREVDEDCETPRGSVAIELLGGIAADRRAIAAAVLELEQEAMGHGDTRYVRLLVQRVQHLRASLDTASDAVGRGRLRGSRDQLRAMVKSLPKRPTSDQRA